MFVVEDVVSQLPAPGICCCTCIATVKSLPACEPKQGLPSVSHFWPWCLIADTKKSQIQVSEGVLLLWINYLLILVWGGIWKNLQLWNRKWNVVSRAQLDIPVWGWNILVLREMQILGPSSGTSRGDQY